MTAPAKFKLRLRGWQLSPAIMMETVTACRKHVPVKL